MSDENEKNPATSGIDLLTAVMDQAVQGTEADECAKEESATIETPEVSRVIQDRLKTADRLVTTDMLVSTLKRIEDQVRKNYPDPDRITVPVSGKDMVIHEDFRREVPPLPPHVAQPKVAIVKGKPVRVGSVSVPAAFDRDGNVVKKSYLMPVYAAEGPDGKPWVDANGEFVVIDPQTGRVRQRVRPQTALTVRKGRSKLAAYFIRLKQWWSHIHFDFKIIKRS